MKPWVAVLVFAVVAGCGTEGLGPGWERIPEMRAPDFTLPTLDGGTVHLAALRGRVVIMEFWATWCGPCRMSTPSLDVIAKKYRDAPVTVLLINQQEGPEAIRQWLERRQFTATILLDLDGKVGRRYGVGGIPQLYVVNPHGDLIYSRTGYGGGLERDLPRIIDELLAPEPAADAV